MGYIDQQDFKIGGPVLLPNAGNKSLFCDTDGTFKSLDATGATSAIVGGAPPEIYSQVAAVAYPIIANDMDVQIVSMRDPTAVREVMSGGAGSNRFAQNLYGGGYRINTTAAVKAFDRIKNSGPASGDVDSGGKTTQFPAPKTDSWYIEVGASLGSPPTDSSRLVYVIGITSANSTDPTNALVALCYTGGHLQIRTEDGAADTVNTAFVDDGHTTAHRFGLSSDGTKLTFWLDGVADANTQSSFQRVPSSPGYLFWGITHASGAVSTDLRITHLAIATRREYRSLS